MYTVTALGHYKAMNDEVSSRMLRILNIVEQENQPVLESEKIVLNRAIELGYII